MPETFIFSIIDDASFYTLADINLIFKRIQKTVNRKLNSEVGQEEQRICVGQSGVAVAAEPVVLEEVGTAKLLQTLECGFYRGVNLQPGTAAGDAITVGQAKELLA